ncbi:MAG: hypothetical protein J6T31_07200 [Methanobrevibacter sp.]|nr:hypothetical protein [Methanobrevibacter sp.]
MVHSLAKWKRMAL